MFVLDRDGRIPRIGAKDPRTSNADATRYPSVDAFVVANRVCQ